MRYAPTKAWIPCSKAQQMGKGGRSFWPGFAGGIIGGAVRPIIAPLPPPPKFIVAPPPPQQIRVWIPGCYIDEMQPNSAVVRRWVPGHYEWR